MEADREIVNRDREKVAQRRGQVGKTEIKLGNAETRRKKSRKKVRGKERAFGEGGKEGEG